MANLPLPRWAYVPGESQEADADFETLARVKLIEPGAFRGYVPALTRRCLRRDLE